MSEYSHYKLVTLGWTDSVPEHWKVERLKRLLFERKENNFPIKTTDILSLTNKRGVIPYSEKGNIGNKSKDRIEDYHLAYPNDLVLNSMNIVIGSVGISRLFGAISPVYYALVSRGYMNIKYCEYIFRLSTFEETLKGLGNGILDIRKRIPMIKLNNVLLPVPPRAEQDQIVRFLDWKVSSVNKLVSNYRSHIELLDEMKQRQIDEAVIRGMHKSDLVHNDDISWDIDYPEHWQIQRIRGSFSFRKGLSITKANLEETGIAVISYGQIHSKKNSGVGLNKDLIKYVNESYLTTNKSCLVEQGDFIFADTSEDMTGCGNCSYIDKDDTIFAGYHSIIAHPSGSTNNKYLAYLFKSFTWRYQVRKKVNGVKVYSITQKMLKDVFILIPPVDEQKEIINYLDEVCAKIDAAIKKLEEMIANLQDLKIRLISDVVTGKIDVRHIEIPAYEFVEEVVGSDAEDDDGEEEAGEQEE